MREKGEHWRGGQLRSRLPQCSFQEENDKSADNLMDFKAERT